MKRHTTTSGTIAALAALVFMVSACTASSDNKTTPSSGGGLGKDRTTTSVAPSASSWGTLSNLCKAGSAKVDTTQNHGGAELNLGTATDKSSTIIPGLLAEMWDASRSFVKWCNDQGGIQGLKINLIDLDAALLQPKPAINQACDRVFAMVGGGITFDDQEFPEFHKCKMVDIAGFTVTSAKAMSNGYVQPIPNPSNDKPATWFKDIAQLRPSDIAKPVIVHGDFQTTVTVAQQYKEQLSKIKGYGTPDMISYSSVSVASWVPFAQKIKDGGYTWFTFVGTPQQQAQLLKAMDQIGSRPHTIVLEANHYDQSIIDIGGKSAEGIIVRTPKHAFQEADRWPAIKKMLDQENANVTNPHIGDLGIQTTSAWLLFVTAANTCLAANHGVLERECLLKAAAGTTNWDGGGLHAPTHPNTNLPPTCNMFLTVKNGVWVRLYPKIGSADDTKDGFHCLDDGVQHLTGDYGKGVIDPSRPILFANEH